MKHVDESGQRSEKIRAVAFSPDAGSAYVATAGDDGRAMLWDGKTAQHLATFTQPGPRLIFTAVAVSPDGTRVIAGDVHGTTLGWFREKADAPVVAIERGFEGTNPLNDSRVRGEIAGISFSAPRGDKIVVASYDHTARLLDGKTFSENGRLLGHADPVVSARFSDYGSRVVTASFDGTARLWDTQVGMPIASLRVGRGYGWGRLRDAAFSRSGKRILTLSADGKARVWDNSGAVLYAWGSGERLNILVSPEQSDTGQEIPLLANCTEAALKQEQHPQADEFTKEFLTARQLLSMYPGGERYRHYRTPYRGGDK